MRRASLLAALLLLAAACGAAAREFPAHGVVVDLLPEQGQHGQVVIDHEAIAGLMPAMTMNFDASPEDLARLEKGAVVDFTVVFDGRSYRATAFRVSASVPVAERAKLAARRDPAPPFALTDQEGRALALEDLRGKVLLVDFIYTHCPGPCPILTAKHVRVQRGIPEALRGGIHFVSITVDPARDTPEALKAYALARGADLAHWSLLTGEPDEVAPVLAAWGVGTRSPEPGAAGGEIDHIVATFLVDRLGRIAERYTGVGHESEAILRDLVRVAGP